ncbi:HD domain-containing protein [candidate division WOR-3 bacterium]|nr:HD domain-containing protein [candidate division WOR-3 bacterium]
MDGFENKINFLREIDKLKSVLRRTYLMDGSRRENSAEHSWHLALMVLVLGEYSNEPVDVLKVLKMVLIHDIVEIDAGDTFLYSDSKEEKKINERQAAKRIFGLLSENLSHEFFLLWTEFEEKKTPEAKFAAAIDRLEPVLQNHATEGRAWRENGIKKEQVVAANRHIEEGSVVLWNFVWKLIEECSEKNMF